MRRIPLRAQNGIVRAYALVDDEDFERFGALPWSMHSKGYAYRNVGRPRRNVLLHRAILGLEFGDPREGDHRNRNRLDCRRENLRIVPAAGNRQNVPARGMSRFRGVRYDRGRWLARVQANGRAVNAGSWDTELEAAIAAQALRDKLLPYAEPDPELARVA